MKDYSMLSGRYLKQQRRRSVLTVLGILLSIALIFALLTMGQALKDNLYQQQIRENGSFHITYLKPGPGLYDTLKGHAAVDQVGRLRPGTETLIDEAFKIYVDQADRNAFDLLPIHLAAGALPSSGHEAAVEEWILPRLPGQPQLGDIIRLNGPDGKPQSYKLTGILENQRHSQLERSSRAFTLLPEAAGKPAEGQNEQLFATFKKGIDISGQLPAFKKLDPSFAENTNILALAGESGDNGLNQALFVIFGTLVGLVILSTVAVIYNSFHISVLERIRQFGLLRTIGATPRQIRHLVFKEASILALIAIPAGLAAGWGGLWLTLWLMLQSGFQILYMEDFQLTFHGWILGLSVGVGLGAVYLAAWLPARKASKVSPVDAVKGAGSIVRESFRRARVPSPLRMLGIEGKMASSNIRRNRTKFRITTFSVVISVMLFIVFHYFAQEAFNMTVDQTENTKFAFELTRHTVQTNEPAAGGNRSASQPVSDIVTPEQREHIAGLPGVEAVYGEYAMPTVFAFIPETVVNPDFYRISKTRAEQVAAGSAQGHSHIARLELYDEAKLSAAARFLESGTADPERLAAENGVVLVQTVKPYNEDEGKREIIPLARYKVGDTLTLQLDEEGNNEQTIRQVKILGILSQSPFDSAYQTNALVVIGTKQTMARLIDALPPDKRPFGTALMGLSIALEDEADPEPVRQALEQIALDIPGGQLVNIVDQQKQERQFALQMQIFVYCFLFVIGLISSLNIINTVQTNLLLRSREIGLLQAVGMTMGQIRKMATAEGVWFGVIGSFWGLLLGGAVSWFLYGWLSEVQGMPFAFPWGGAILACLFATGIGLFSVQGPLRRMSKSNLIDELRENA